MPQVASVLSVVGELHERERVAKGGRLLPLLLSIMREHMGP